MSTVIVAQAAATSAALLDGKFVLGIGTGEALNEHILGQVFPSADVRLEMLDEAVEVIRELWTGEVVTRRGQYYTVDTARLYTLPAQPPAIYLSGFGPKAVEVAGRIADGYITTMPDQELVERFRQSGGAGKPTQAGFKVSYADTREEGVKIAHRLWANAGVPGELAQVLPSPKHFEQASGLVTEEMTSESIAAGKDPDEHLNAFEPYLEVGFDDIYVANMGPHYAEMISMYGDQVLPQLRTR